MLKISETYQHFLDETFKLISTINIDVSELQLDHIAYRSLNSEQYENNKKELLSEAELLSQIETFGRKVSVYKFHTPLVYRNYVIPFFELFEPKAGTNKPERYVHIEFVIKTSLEEFIKKYPLINFDISHTNNTINPEIGYEFENLTGVKFHQKDIGEVVKIQNEQLQAKTIG